MIWVVVLLVAALIYVARKYVRLKDAQIVRDTNARIAIHAELKAGFDWAISDFRARELETARLQERESARLEFERWKVEHTKTERADAVKQSRAVNKGLISEHFAPFLENWPYNPKDCKFSGQPIDYLVFDGMDDGELKQIVLVDVKTGQSQLTTREKQVRDAVAFGKVKFEVFRPQEGAVN